LTKKYSVVKKGQEKSQKNDIGENKEEISMCLKQLEKSVQLNLQFSKDKNKIKRY